MMNEIDDKPFACTATGCGMRFANEDHLTVHRKKHEMSLNLSTAASLKSSALFVDQTPTPTRFIRSLDEVGLFQDLQTVNPFEEQFRRAVEAARSNATTNNGPTVVVHQPEPTDTLNTPSVLVSDLVDSTTTTTSTSSTLETPRNQEPSSTTVDSDDEVPANRTAVNVGGSSPSSTVASVIMTAAPQVISMSLPSSTSTPVAQPTSVITNATTTTVVQLMLKLPDGRSIPLQIPAAMPVSAPPVPPPVIVVSTQQQQQQPTMTMTTTNTTSLAKMRLKQALTQNQPTSTSSGNNSMSVITEAVSMVTSQRHFIDAALAADGRHAELVGKRRRTSEDDPDEKRRRFLERNRAAATRCRLKRKQWIQALEKKADDLAAANQQLLNAFQNEVAMLRNEVAQLKTMLLAHKNCPVTLQQQRGVLKIEGLPLNSCGSGIPADQEVTTIQITSAEAIASSALTNMAQSMAAAAAASTSHDPNHIHPNHILPNNILPVDIIIESDPMDLVTSPHENSNPDN